VFLPWLGININKFVIRNLLGALVIIDVDYCKGYISYLENLNSLVSFVLDNRVALDYMLAEKRVVCGILNTSCNTWVNTFDMVKISCEKSTNRK
jgi:hypothetical protein